MHGLDPTLVKGLEWQLDMSKIFIVIVIVIVMQGLDPALVKGSKWELDISKIAIVIFMHGLVSCFCCCL